MPKTEEGHTESFWLRVDEITEMILKERSLLQSKRGESFTQKVMTKLNVEDRMAKEYIKYAKKAVRLKVITNLEVVKKNAVLDREALLLDAETIEEKRKIMKDRDEILGAYTTKVEQKVTVSLKGFDITRLTDEQLKIVEAMIKREEDPRNYLTSLGLYVGSAD